VCGVSWGGVWMWSERRVARGREAVCVRVWVRGCARVRWWWVPSGGGGERGARAWARRGASTAWQESESGAKRAGRVAERERARAEAARCVFDSRVARSCALQCAKRGEFVRLGVPQPGGSPPGGAPFFFFFFFFGGGGPPVFGAKRGFFPQLPKGPWSAA